MGLRLAQRTDQNSFCCVPHVLVLYVCGTAASYAIAVAFDELIEPRLRAALARVLSAGLRLMGVQWGWEDLAGMKPKTTSKKDAAAGAASL